MGPTMVAVAAKIRLLRKKRGITTEVLSKLVADAGRTIHPSGITRLEKGDRRIDVDDLVAFATALGVAPAHLLELPGDCSICRGEPPAGFTCNACGTAGDQR
jgi:transcriptional regulator with XRE-family HTH domain